MKEILSTLCGIFFRILLCCIFILLTKEAFAQPSKSPSAVNLENRSNISADDRAISKLGGSPTITLDGSDLTVFEAEVGKVSEPQFYYIELSDFNSEVTVTIAVGSSVPFTISTGGGPFGKTIELTTSPFENFQSDMIEVRYEPTDAGPHDATITHSADGAETKTLTVDGNITTTPVQWHSFQARADSEIIILDWTTASEKDNSHFEIEFSENPMAGFTKIGRINSKVGNSNQATSYTFDHYFNSTSGLCYFRIKQVDFDNSFSYSKVIAIKVTRTSEATITVAPNPITDNARLSITSTEGGPLRLFIFNAKSAEIYSNAHLISGGKSFIRLPMNDIPAGIYYLVTEINGKTTKQKLIKQ